MTDFTGMKCPVCGEPFAAADDIVVCPECGAPYHRACYHKAGHCIFADRHGTPEAWTPPAPQVETASKDCPRCSHKNSAEALFCEQCGASLSKNEQTAYTRQTPLGGEDSPSQQGGAVPFSPFDPMGGVSPTEDIGGVPAADLIKVVQVNTPYYIPVFHNRAVLHKNRFNFAAFLFSGSWLLYRKQYKHGWAVSAVLLTIHAVYQYLTYVAAYPVMQKLMNDVGVPADAYPTPEQMMLIGSHITALPFTQQIVVVLPSILMVATFVIKLIVGFKANQLYCTQCVEVIRFVESASVQTSERAVRYQEKGGVNTTLALGIILCYLVITYIPLLFM